MTVTKTYRVRLGCENDLMIDADSYRTFADYATFYIGEEAVANVRGWEAIVLVVDWPEGGAS